MPSAASTIESIQSNYFELLEDNRLVQQCRRDDATGEWGIPYPGQQYDLLRAEMVASKTPSPVENMTISFDQAGDKCTMHVDWADTRASVDFVEKK